MKILKIQIRSAKNVGKVWISSKDILPAPFGAIPGHFLHGPQKCKTCTKFGYFPWWANGCYSPGLAAIPTFGFTNYLASSRICFTFLWIFDDSIALFGVRRGPEMIVCHRAPSSLMSSYRAIWTHFRANSMIFIDLILQTGKNCWHLGQAHNRFTTDSRQIHHRFTRDAS